MKVYDKTLQRRQNYQYERYNVTFPEIRLMGRWLQECGFSPGQEIEVSTEASKLTITIAPVRKNETR
ncbi:type I addiction module toxin, SymE family [Crocinitomicaceae bacterium CZZ-1]|uniref:Type I addiction module toxin, SymE family n=1 Tax=Taishania pollutisoli TaxID=2766479 RepID=A0A8J6P7B7_9FLAO|nr:SymE family type I addiction module toxin [Taishania pollutisoli]MBC9813369.1 type I addiction module toxin, SymE family [Taishania pollutisoli]